MRKIGMMNGMHGSMLAAGAILAAAAATSPATEIASAGRHRGWEPATKPARQMGKTSALNNQRL